MCFLYLGDSFSNIITIEKYAKRSNIKKQFFFEGKKQYIYN